MEELQAWQEWKEICAIDSCSQESRSLLLPQADKWFNNKLYKLSKEFRFSDYKGEGIGFSYIELHAISHTYQKDHHEHRGKSYKDAMFLNAARDDNPLVALRKQAQVYLTTAVRESIHMSDTKKGVNKNSFSLDNKVQGTDNDMTYHDLLNAEVDNVNSNAYYELKSIAEQVAKSIFDEMEFVHKVILFCESARYTYSNSKAVLEVTELSRSTLGERSRKDLEGYSKRYGSNNSKPVFSPSNLKYLPHFTNLFPDEDLETVLMLYQLTLEAIKKSIAIDWGHSEIRCATILKEAGIQ